MKTSFDSEIEFQLRAEINNGSVSISSNEECFKIIEMNFPVSLNRIYWEKVDRKLFQKVKINDLKEEIRLFFDDVEKMTPGIVFDNVIVCGDDAISQSYEMPYMVFKGKAYLFFELPQHTYALSRKNKYCFNYTFEDELFFGIVDE